MGFCRLKNFDNLLNSNFSAQPIDMDTIEVEKQDRKRQRNRIAATKCRKRKIERITQLEHEVRELNDQLQKRIKAKRELEIEVDEIRNRLKIHIKQGCSGLEESGFSSLQFIDSSTVCFTVRTKN